MKIIEVKENKKQYLDLLLLADEQEDMVDRYLDNGKMYILDDNGVKCECVILQIHPVSEQSSCKQFLTYLAVPDFHPVLSRQRIFPYNPLEHSLFRPDDRTHSKLCFCLLLLCSSFCGKVLRTASGF